MEEAETNNISLGERGDNTPRQIFNAPGKQKSKVWTVFGFYKTAGKLDRSHAICKLCRASLTYSGSITNLDQHAKRKHGEEYGEFTEQKRVGTSGKQARTENAIPTFFQRLGQNSARAREITASITRFIAKGLCPYNIVEWEGFQDLIHTLEPRYKIPSRNHITNTCMPALYAQVKSQVEEKLAKAERVAITTDAWTSCATESYVTITAHHIAPDWELNVYVLQTRAFKGSHTGKNVGALLKQACADWKILDKEPALVTDNATNMVLAGVEAEMTPHLMCFAHTINLATQKAFKVDTVARLLGKPAISAALMSRDLRRGEELNTLKDKDFCDVEDIVKLMVPVKLVTISMCEDKRPTLSVISPVREKLKKTFEAADEDSVVIREMKQAFREDLEKRYTGLEDLFHTAAALDPRFKSLPFLTDHDAERTFANITAKATSLHNKALATGDPIHGGPLQTTPCQTEPALGELDIRIDAPQTQHEPEDDLPPFKKKKISALDQLLGKDFDVRMAATSVRDKASEEVKRYRERASLPLEENLLQWWKEQQDLPLLSSLAKRYLCIPATSVASERVFSTAGDIVSTKRSLLKHEHVDQLIFLKKNLPSKKN
nr:E3 SUMO-protein ligase ZBED1-like [Nothobranchius furzeri]